MAPGHVSVLTFRSNRFNGHSSKFQIFKALAQNDLRFKTYETVLYYILTCINLKNMVS